MTFILEKLYLGSVDDAFATQRLQENHISHILTIDCKPLPIEKRSEFEYKYVNALDMDDSDLLSRLQDCIDFIHTGRHGSEEGGGVLVHCHAGQSRSATVLIAYMMQKLHMTLDDASQMVKKLRPSIKPNAGFWEQLELFEKMGSVVERESAVYKLYRLAILAQKVQAASVCDGLGADNMAADPSQQVAAAGALYKCKKCRRALFRDSAVLPHTVGKGEAAFDWRNHKVCDSAGAVRCHQQLFIEPVAWMEQELLTLQGKISCPKCRSKLGSFCWAGERCPCGTWITPAIHIQTNKVDFCPVRPAPALPTLATQIQRRTDAAAMSAQSQDAADVSAQSQDAAAMSAQSQDAAAMSAQSQDAAAAAHGRQDSHGAL